MKLRNKKTGEIVDMQVVVGIVGKDALMSDDFKGSNSLAELNEEWEDYNYDGWFIEIKNGTIVITRDLMLRNSVRNRYREYGLYFETKEQAEKAIEKLKAWKRLKDKGFRFDGYDSGHNSNKELCGQAYFKAGNFWFDIKQDLDLLFNSEDNISYGWDNYSNGGTMLLGKGAKND